MIHTRDNWRHQPRRRLHPPALVVLPPPEQLPVKPGPPPMTLRKRVNNFVIGIQGELAMIADPVRRKLIADDITKLLADLRVK